MNSYIPALRPLSSYIVHSYLVAAVDSGQDRLEYPRFIAGSLGVGLYDLRSERKEDDRDQDFSRT